MGLIDLVTSLLECSFRVCLPSRKCGTSTELRIAILDAFNEAGIAMPFRQTDATPQGTKGKLKTRFGHRSGSGTRVSDICQGTRLGSSANTGCRERAAVGAGCQMIFPRRTTPELQRRALGRGLFSASDAPRARERGAWL